jgi:hypothetical protein
MAAPTVETAPAQRGTHWRGLAWVTWRQHRFALAGAVALLGGLAILMLVTGVHMHHEYATLGLAHCGNINGPRCAPMLSLFTADYGGWAMYLPRFFEFLPAVIGMFVGAPLLARELESGTFRFVWTQGCSRTSWILSKLVLLGAAVTVLALAFTAVFAWWFAPWLPIMGRMSAGQAYEVLGIVFAARTVFAFVLGVLAGALLRRVVPAIAVTGIGWLAVAWPTVTFLRPALQAPLVAPEDALPLSASWTIHSWIQDGAGHHLSTSALRALYARAQQQGVTGDRLAAWLAGHGYTRWDSYQPDGRFWHFQAIEAGGYLALAVSLGALTVWLVRRQLT